MSSCVLFMLCPTPCLKVPREHKLLSSPSRPISGDFMLHFRYLITMGENWDEAPAQTAAEPLPAVTAEYAEVKLFGKWSCDEVQVSDISLTVSNGIVITVTIF